MSLMTQVTLLCCQVMLFMAHLCLLNTRCAVLRLSSVSSASAWALTSTSGGRDWGPENLPGCGGREDIRGAADSRA